MSFAARRAALHRSERLLVACDFSDALDFTRHLWPGTRGSVRLDERQRCSGRWSVLYQYRPDDGPFPDGGFFLEFRPVGPGERLWVQWRQRFNGMWLRMWPEGYVTGNGGWKQCLVDRAKPPGARRPIACGPGEIVVQSRYGWFPWVYHSCGAKFVGDAPAYEGLFRYLPDGDIDLEPGRGCSYRYALQHKALAPTCVGYAADTWMTFQLGIEVGTLNRPGDRAALPYTADSHIQLWIQPADGRPAILTVDMPSFALVGHDPYGTAHFQSLDYARRVLKPYPEVAESWVADVLIALGDRTQPMGQDRIPDAASEGVS